VKQTENPKVEVTRDFDGEMAVERKRISEINALQRQFPQQLEADTIERAINDPKMTVADLQRQVLDEMSKGNVSREADQLVGMNDKEVEQYSIVRALRLKSEGKELDGIEKEASDAVSRALGKTPGGFFVPADAWVRRDLTAGTATAGGNTVATNLLSGSFIDILRNRAKVLQLGATTLTGLTGDVAIPRQTTAGTAAQAAENGALSETNQAFNQLTLTPTRVGAFTEISKQLLQQSSLDIEALVRDDLTQAIALKLDAMALNGSGSSNEPTGVINTSGVGAVTFGGAATWADVVEFETDVASGNADVNDMAFLTTAAVRGAWKTIEKASSTGQFLWGADNMPNGYRAEVSEQVPSNKVCFGNWRDLVVAMFGGLDVVVDPYSLATTGLVRCTLSQFYDIGVRQAASFSISADAGNQ